MYEDEGDFDSRLVDVSDALEDVERPGDCFVSGVLSEYAPPGLSIRELGEIPLPLTEVTAKQVIERCHLVPYSHREETIVDTSVRKTWELNADAFELQNPKWQTLVDGIVETIRVPLGISDAIQVTAKLYKMLLYEKGGKFAKHQDSEKELGMFGTLVVMLPCRFEGGELIVHHPLRVKKEPHEWNPAAVNPYNLKYAAFYGDCEHEVKEVTSGYRLCLTYNLVAVDSNEIPQFGANHMLYDALQTSLKAFFEETSSTKRQRANEQAEARPASVPGAQRNCQLVYVFEHKYTNPGLSFSFLKGRDHVIARCLAKFCEDNKGAFGVYLSKVRYTYSYDPDCKEEDLQEKTVMLEAPWVKYGDGNLISCPNMSVQLNAEVVPVGFFDDVSFDGSEYECYTGKEGSRMEKWYTSAALVVQPLRIEVEQLAKGGMDHAVKKWLTLVESESDLAILYSDALFASNRQWSTSSPTFRMCLPIVERLDDAPLLIDILSSLNSVGYVPDLVKTVEKLGWDKCFDGVCEVAGAAQLKNRVNLLASLVDESTDASRVTALLDKVSLENRRDPYGYYSYSSQSNQLTPDEYARVLAIIFRSSPQKIDSIVEKADDNNLIKIIAPALVIYAHSLGSTDLPQEVVKIMTAVRDQVHSKTPAQPSWALADVRLSGGRTCCGECSVLQRFLNSATEKTIRMPMSKDRRRHIHQAIDRACRGKLSHGTDRSMTLVITKLLPDMDLFDVAKQAIRDLNGILGTEPSAAAEQNPRASSPDNEIIEIGSDY